MKTKRKEYPWLTKSVSRHGTISWRFRKDGVDAYIKHLYGSTAFIQEYQALLNGSKVVVKTAAVGSIDWVCIEYLSSSDFKNLRASTKKTKIRRISRLRKKYGHLDLRTLEPRHVKKMHDQLYETPEAANGQLKLLRQLVKLAMFHGVLKSDPTVGVKLFKSSDVGFYTWTEEDIAKFEGFHGAKSKETFALRLVINSGAARSDVSKLGPHSLLKGRIQYSRTKTDQFVDLRQLPELKEVLADFDQSKKYFISYGDDQPYRPETFGNWFKDAAMKAGIKEGNSHGLRKAGATRLAHAGANELEIMAFLGHKDTTEAITYVRAAKRSILADSGMDKLEAMSNHSKRLGNNNDNSLKTGE